MNILHATTEPNLLTRLQEMLGSSARADIAVGYLFMSGFQKVAGSFERLEKVRILVGRSDRPTLEEAALGAQQAEALRAQLEADSIVQRRERESAARESVEHVAAGVASLPQDADSERAVRSLRDMIASGKAEVRAYLRSPLHAKAYLCWYENHAEPGAAVVGSSNMTLAGFSGNTELNVRVTGDAEMEALREWFETLWKDSQDISEALEAALARSWPLAATPPYHVYLKGLYELYYADVPDVELRPQRTEELANFQMDAVRQGLRMIEEHGGAYIGDVVGLGKTYVGAELLRQLRASYPNDGPPLILCPAGLKSMWESFNERFALGAAVVSHSVVAPPPDAEFDEELGRYVESERAGQGIVLGQAYPNRGAVLVDEAHNFRNVNRRSIGLRSYLESGDHKVILLSATPQNLGPMDIYRQLTLFLDDMEHGLNIEPASLSAYFNNAQRWQQHRAEFEEYEREFRAWEASKAATAPPLPPAAPSVPKADIAQALAPVFIRRRRKDIERLYGDTAMVAGEPVVFPEPVLDNVAYRLDRVYAKAGSLEELVGGLRQHKGARYRATDYVRAEARGKDEYRDLFRAAHRIAALMNVLLLKRLESSIEAFRSTLRALSQSNRNFRSALGGGYVPIGDTAARMLAGQAFEAGDLLEMLSQEEERRRGQGNASAKLVHDVADFDVVRWMDDLDADHGVLSGVLSRVSGITAEDDDKLRALRDFLEREEVKGEKILIFSEAETTISYLYRELNPGEGDPGIAMLTGSVRHQAESVVKRFSPGSNLSRNEKRPGPEIRILLATDIVSEGQNLQDCARALNYDLHWNPVRLIQRFGRVDRIGTRHSVIRLHNMWPDVEVDAGLSLTERVGRRIQSFHDAIGLDNQLLSEGEHLNDDALYCIYDRKEMPDAEDGLGEVTAHQHATAELQRIKEGDPELWRTITELPDGIRSALRARPERSEFGDDNYARNGATVDGEQAPLMSPATMAPSPFEAPKPSETIVLLGAGGSRGVNGCYAVGSDLQPRAITPAQFVEAARCEPDAPAEPLPEDTNERVTAAFEAFKREFQRRLGRARRSHDSRARRYVSGRLNAALREAGEAVDAGRIDALRRIFTGDLPQQAEQELSKIREQGLAGSELRTRLEALRARFRLAPPEDSDRPQAREPQVVRTVCSDGLEG